MMSEVTWIVYLLPMFSVSVESEGKQDSPELEVESVESRACKVGHKNGEQCAIAKRLLEAI